MRPIDADAYVTVMLYDDEKEEFYEERMTIAEALDRYTSEGCPPTIEPKRGEWIHYTIGSGCFCSNCDWDGDDMIDECILEDLDYCPNCGAKMDKEKSDE